MPILSGKQIITNILDTGRFTKKDIVDGTCLDSSNIGRLLQCKGISTQYLSDLFDFCHNNGLGQHMWFEPPPMPERPVRNYRQRRKYYDQKPA